MAIRCLSDGTNSGSVRFDSRQRVRWQRSCVFGRLNAVLDIQEWWPSMGRRRAEQATRAKRALITCQVARARCRSEEAAALRRIDAATKIERCWRRHIQKRRAQCDAALMLARAEMSEQDVSAPSFFIGDYGAEDANGGEGEEWFVDWATLDNQHAGDCVEEKCGALVLNCAIIDSTKLDALGKGCFLGQQTGGTHVVQFQGISKECFVGVLRPKSFLGADISQPDSAELVVESSAHVQGIGRRPRGRAKRQGLAPVIHQKTGVG